MDGWRLAVFSAIPLTVSFSIGLFKQEDRNQREDPGAASTSSSAYTSCTHRT
ncbi:hypothetical protein SAMN05421736_112139 [Evansella caseinilytica]|uniref:Uncharacterized protein n=1 Tax=Evansella caseinilytica TaxID=1503961 RepID=A0A1H3SYX0_9BACI|nr:hypothetical protein SAMN05421736_112139 [Evansella caseinilytica]